MKSINGEEPFNLVNFRSHWKETITNAGKTYFVIFTVQEEDGLVESLWFLLLHDDYSCLYQQLMVYSSSIFSPLNIFVGYEK